MFWLVNSPEKILNLSKEMIKSRNNWKKNIYNTDKLKVNLYLKTHLKHSKVY